MSNLLEMHCDRTELISPQYCTTATLPVLRSHTSVFYQANYVLSVRCELYSVTETGQTVRQEVRRVTGLSQLVISQIIFTDINCHHRNQSSVAGAGVGGGGGGRR